MSTQYNTVKFFTLSATPARVCFGEDGKDEVRQREKDRTGQANVYDAADG
jgi:CDP-glycerol glycerophosphotransferase (TagB/SpsB family)